MDLEKLLKDLEKNFIETTLLSFGGQVGKTADYLGFKRTTLSEKLRRYGITVRDETYQEGDEPLLKVNPLNMLKMSTMIDALKVNNWNRAKTAEQLGVSIRTIRYWIKHAKKCGKIIPDYVKTTL